MSTLDLFRGAFVLLAGQQGQAWIDAVARVAPEFPGLPIETHVIGGDVAAAYGISASGASLVRPDGFVAWRSPSNGTDPGGELGRTLAAILDR